MTRKETKAKLEDIAKNILWGSGEYSEALDIAIKALEQEQKTGHWIVVSDGYGDGAYICECSECADTVWVYRDADRKWNYCPNCGCKMSEVRKYENIYR